MGRGGLRGAFAAWLGLIALQALSTQGGSGRVAELFRDVDAAVQRLFDPTVPAIGDRSGGASSSSSSTPTTPGAVGNFTTADAATRNNPAPSQASRLPVARQPY